MNVYVGLKIGWSFGASIISAILGFVFFKTFSLGKNYTILENNITQTTGSAAGSMASAAGLLAPIPALMMLDYHIPAWALYCWAIAVAFLGVMFAVPLRRQYVVNEKLKFPTGLATANTISALYASSEEALRKAKVLGYFATGAFIFTIIAHFVPALEQPPIHEWLNSALLTSLALWGFSLLISPVMLGAGMLVGIQVASSLLLGAVAGWSLGYFAFDNGWAPAENPMTYFDEGTGTWGARGWILWPGVAVMVSDAIMTLFLSFGTIIKSFSSISGIGSGGGKSGETIPNSWWIWGLVFASVITVTIGKIIFNIPVFPGILAIILSFILANVAVRAVGETDINPIGGVGKVTQIVFGTISSSVAVNLLSAGITGGGASQAADMMQDFKTGAIFKASPRKQFIAQLWGIGAGIVFAVPVFLLFNSAWEIGGADSPLPAPAARAWQAVAIVMTRGFEALPEYAPVAILFGGIFGAVLAVVRKFIPKASAYLPSGIAFGIAFIIPAYYSVTIFLGAVLFILWRRKKTSQAEALVFPVASGLLAGEGLGGIISAVLTLMGV